MVDIWSFGLVRRDNRIKLVKTKLALEELETGQILKLIVDYEPAVEEVPKAMEYEGHRTYPITPFGLQVRILRRNKEGERRHTQRRRVCRASLTKVQAKRSYGIGSKVIEVKRINLTDWEIIIEKENGSYAI